MSSSVAPDVCCTPPAAWKEPLASRGDPRYPRAGNPLGRSSLLAILPSGQHEPPGRDCFQRPRRSPWLWCSWATPARSVTRARRGSPSTISVPDSTRPSPGASTPAARTSVRQRTTRRAWRVSGGELRHGALLLQSPRACAAHRASRAPSRRCRRRCRVADLGEKRDHLVRVEHKDR